MISSSQRVVLSNHLYVFAGTPTVLFLALWVKLGGCGAGYFHYVTVCIEKGIVWDVGFMTFYFRVGLH